MITAPGFHHVRKDSVLLPEFFQVQIEDARLMQKQETYQNCLTRILQTVALEKPDRTPDTVYDYCTRLIRELGPGGFMLQSGCDIPTNAKLENVKAMVAAALA